MRHATSVERFQLETGFQSVRASLQKKRDRAILDRPLGHWAVASDRRLPLAFLDRTIGQLIETPFEKLVGTPGVGLRKIDAMLMLLQRAANASDAPANKKTPPRGRQRASSARGENGRASPRFDDGLVSETTWELWRDTVRRHRLQDETLGRMIGSLQSLPTNWWNTPLGRYLDLPLAAIRRTKTHGQKRVRTILEVFHTVQQMAGAAPSDGPIAVCFLPRPIAQACHWLVHSDFDQSVSLDEVRRQLGQPLVGQIEIDCGKAISRLVAGRWGLAGPAQSAKSQAQKLRLTRARVYQMLEQAQHAMQVRWPEGRWCASAVGQRVRERSDDGPGAELLLAVADFLADTPLH